MLQPLITKVFLLFCSKSVYLYFIYHITGTTIKSANMHANYRLTNKTHNMHRQNIHLNGTHVILNLTFTCNYHYVHIIVTKWNKIIQCLFSVFFRYNVFQNLIIGDDIYQIMKHQLELFNKITKTVFKATTHRVTDV